MKTIWNRAAWLMVLTTGVAAAAISCTDTSTSPSAADAARIKQVAADKKVAVLRSKYGWPADYHTRVLEYTYTQLIKEKAKSLSPADKCRVMEKAVAEFHTAYRRDGQPLGPAEGAFAATACDPKVRKQIIAGPPAGVVPRQNDISSNAMEMLAQIDQAVDNAYSLASLRTAIYSIESNAAATLEESEAGAVMSAGELTISSAEYWEQNADIWAQTVSSDRPLMYDRAADGHRVAKVVVAPPGATARFDWKDKEKRIIRADISAFIAAIIFDWWTGPVAWGRAALRAGAASLATAILPY